jgi:hypothetical protein
VKEMYTYMFMYVYIAAEVNLRCFGGACSLEKTDRRREQ